MLRLKAESEAEEERKKRELEEIAAEKERIKREEEEAFAEKERIKREEAENIWAIESAKRQEEEALMLHEKRLFDAANAAAEYHFFKQNVLAEDLERDRLEREKGEIIDDKCSLFCALTCCAVLCCAVLCCAVM